MASMKLLFSVTFNIITSANEVLFDATYSMLIVTVQHFLNHFLETGLCPPYLDHMLVSSVLMNCLTLVLPSSPASAAALPPSSALAAMCVVYRWSRKHFRASNAMPRRKQTIREPGN